MSFDTEFNYAKIATDLEADIIAIQTKKDEINTQINCVTMCAGYESITAPRLAALNSTNITLSTQLVDFATAIDAVNLVLALSSPEKTKLYDFYLLVGYDRQSFMCKVLYNHATMLSNADITTLLADVTNDLPTKKMVAGLINSTISVNLENLSLKRAILKSIG